MCMTCDIIQDLDNKLFGQDVIYQMYALVKAHIYDMDGKIDHTTTSGIIPLRYCPECGSAIDYFKVLGGIS